MRITQSKLRKIIRQSLKEAWSPEKGFYVKEQDLPIYYEEIKNHQHIRGRMKFEDAMVKAIEARGLRWDRHTFDQAEQDMKLNESFTVYSERGKYIESSDGSLLQLAGMDEAKIIVSNGRERGSLVLGRGGRIYFQTNRRDQYFANLQELCDYLNENNFEYEGIDDY